MASSDFDDVAVVVGCALVESAVGPVGVVVLYVVQSSRTRCVELGYDPPLRHFLQFGAVRCCFLPLAAGRCKYICSVSDG